MEPAIEEPIEAGVNTFKIFCALKRNVPESVKVGYRFALATPTRSDWAAILALGASYVRTAANEVPGNTHGNLRWDDWDGL